jgi:hypothetical protein
MTNPIIQVGGALVLVWLLRLALKNYLSQAKGISVPNNSAFKIYFNRSERMTTKTPLQTASLIVRDSAIEISGDISLTIPFAEISSLRLEFPHSSVIQSHLIELKYRSGEVIYLGVLRAALFKAFVVNNLLQTVTLFESIRKKIPKNLAWSVLDR